MGSGGGGLGNAGERAGRWKEEKQEDGGDLSTSSLYRLRLTFAIFPALSNVSPLCSPFHCFRCPSALGFILPTAHRDTGLILPISSVRKQRWSGLWGISRSKSPGLGIGPLPCCLTDLLPSQDNARPQWVGNQESRSLCYMPLQTHQDPSVANGSSREVNHKYYKDGRELC